MREFTKGTGSELSCFCESRCAFNSVPVPFVNGESSPTVDTGTGTATQEFYPRNKGYCHPISRLGTSPGSVDGGSY